MGQFDKVVEVGMPLWVTLLYNAGDGVVCAPFAPQVSLRDGLGGF